jgi:aminoglycoside 3-N-acetyltransferase
MGVGAGTTLIVHSSLKALGWVAGGAPTVVRALIDVLGEEGTLAMPAATPQCGDRSPWHDPKMPDARLEDLRHHLPIFDVATTPTTLGAIPETFRTWPGTLRSDHPLESVCARGAHAATITREHPLAFSEGPGSPFARLHELGSFVLLLGVGFNRCTALHFAESMASNRRTMKVRFPRLEGGRRIWIDLPNVADDNDTHFPLIGKQFMSCRQASEGLVGEARSICFPMRDLVEVALEYFATLPNHDG